MDVFDIAEKNITEWEGGAHYFNPDTKMWKAYDDLGYGAVGPGIRGKLGDIDIEIGKEYPASLVSEEYKKRLMGDYNWLESSLGDSWSGLNMNQQAAVMSLLHNVGSGAFGKSKAFQNLKNRDLEGFAHEAFDPNIGFVKAGGKTLKGLQNRRDNEKNLFFTDMAENAFLD